MSFHSHANAEENEQQAQVAGSNEERIQCMVLAKFSCEQLSVPRIGCAKSQMSQSYPIQAM